MTKTQLIEKLKKELSFLPAEELESRLAFYSEMIDDRIEDGLTEEEVAEILKTPDDYDVRIRIETSYKDTVYEYRYYHYSERQSMITVNGGDGEFRVLRTFTDKMVADAGRVISGEPINATDKY